MKVTIDPEIPRERTFSLNYLTLDQVGVLLCVLRNITGSFEKSPRKFSNEVSNALNTLPEVVRLRAASFQQFLLGSLSFKEE